MTREQEKARDQERNQARQGKRLERSGPRHSANAGRKTASRTRYSPQDDEQEYDRTTGQTSATARHRASH